VRLARSIRRLRNFQRDDVSTEAGEMLPLNEISGCLPSAVAAKDGKIYSDPCDYPYLSQQDRYNILSMYNYQCPTDHAHDWSWDCPPDKKNGCGKPRQAMELIIGPKKQRRADFSTRNGYPAADHSLLRVFLASWSRARISRKALCVCVTARAV
jgi:hypothetical protein